MSNVVFMMMKDLVKVYKLFNSHLHELLDRFPALGKEKCLVVCELYENFTKHTQITKNVGELLLA